MTSRFRSLRGGVASPRGYRIAAAAVGIRPGTLREDLALVVSDWPAVVAGLFTTNQVKAAPVLWSQDAVQSGSSVRAVLLNSGNANACTGRAGMRAVRRSAATLAGLLHLDEPRAVLVASTGVIGVSLPIQKILDGLPALTSRLSSSAQAGAQAARAIMTTDTHPKFCAVEVRVGDRRYRVGGMAKGAGMIHPQMATLLCLVTTDAPLTRRQVRRMLVAAVEPSFNSITVDGDTSTNDCAILLANGAAGGRVPPGGQMEKAVRAAIEHVCAKLAEAVAADGEGAHRLIEVRVRGTRTEAEARRVARTVASSLLVKTAVHGGDPNWGRILAAAGRSGVRLDPSRMTLAIGNHVVARAGLPCPRAERGAARHLRGRVVRLHLRVGHGPGAARALGTDLSADYVAINAHYRS
jgi:glutamate N-acetyltransferase / amino-acid N-acetyltransferase